MKAKRDGYMTMSTWNDDLIDFFFKRKKSI